MSLTRIKQVEGGYKEYTNNPDNLKVLESFFSSFTTRKGQALSAITIKNYINKLNRVSILCQNKSFDNDTFLLNPNNVLKCLNESGLKSKKDYISAIVRYLKGHDNVDEKIIKIYNDAMNDFKKEEGNNRNDNLASEKHVKNSMPLDEIKEKMLNYDIKDDNDIVNLLVLAFYFGNSEYLVPRNDLVNMKIISVSKAKKKLNPKFNYIVVDNQQNPIKIIMKSYKTSAAYGQKSFKISQFLQNLLKLYIKKWGKMTGDYLFLMRDNRTPFSHQNFANLLEKAALEVLGKPMNIDLIRQIIITDWYLKHPLASVNDKVEFAGRFLHSPAVNVEYMRKNLNV